MILNEVLGTKFKLVTGYLGSQETILGDRARRGAWPLRVQLFRAQDRQARLAARQEDQRARSAPPSTRAPTFPDVPAVVDLVTKPEDRQLLELMVGPAAMARPFAAPPGLPANKAALLRRAFDATMKDPEFLAEAAKIQADVSPTTGEDVQKLVGRIYATPRPVIERVKKLFAH